MLEHLVERRRQVHARLHGAGLGESRDQPLGLGQDGIGPHAALLKYGAHHPFLFFGQGDEQMHRKHHLALILLRHALRLLQGFLGFLSQSV